MLLRRLELEMGRSIDASSLLNKLEAQPLDLEVKVDALVAPLSDSSSHHGDRGWRMDLSAGACGKGGEACFFFVSEVALAKFEDPCVMSIYFRVLYVNLPAAIQEPI
jgi:hypothetical protein